MQQINAALRKTPREAGLGGNIWDGKTLAAWIEKQYGVSLGVRQCQRMFRQLGFRLRKPRPALAQANPQLQRMHKKLQALMRDESVDLWATDEVHCRDRLPICLRRLRSAPAQHHKRENCRANQNFALQIISSKLPRHLYHALS